MSASDDFTMFMWNPTVICPQLRGKTGHCAHQKLLLPRGAGGQEVCEAHDWAPTACQPHRFLPRRPLCGQCKFRQEGQAVVRREWSVRTCLTVCPAPLSLPPPPVLCMRLVTFVHPTLLFQTFVHAPWSCRCRVPGGCMLRVERGVCLVRTLSV